jgi:AcrR family transcriptional regulator
MANSASSKRTGLRKQPTQARSRERVADILKATASVLAEVGYEGLSTNLVAERAGVPVGSIYQFFETKDDIVAALVEQFQGRILRLAKEQLDAALAARDRRAFIARLIEGIAGIQADSSAFICVFSGSPAHPGFDGLARELRRTLIDHLDRVFAEAFPKLAKDDRKRMLAAWSDITGALAANLDRSKPAERARLLEELKLILGAYLDAKLAGPG